MSDLLSQKKAKEAMIEYLKLKVAQEDWHAVADAAMDIREIVARIELLKELMTDKTNPHDP